MRVLRVGDCGREEVVDFLVVLIVGDKDFVSLGIEGECVVSRSRGKRVRGVLAS